MKHLSVIVIALVCAQLSCSKSVPPARAFKVQARSELVGGQRALGEIGDYKLSNGIIHAIIQDVGTSRGFGAFGGSLIDVDLVREGRKTQTQQPVGNDFFTEMFPAFFLQAIEPSKVEVFADGSDGSAAIIRVSGAGGEFISIVKELNDSLNLVPTANLQYTVDYILAPGAQFLKIVVTINNVDILDQTCIVTAECPMNYRCAEIEKGQKRCGRDANYGAVIPFGFVTLLGEGQRLFLPNEAGFDVRFHLEEVFKRPGELEALPGEVVPMITTAGEGVSYAVAAGPTSASYMRNKPTFYEPYGAKPDSMLIPIASSSFLGTFWSRPPALPSGDPGIQPGKSFSFGGYLAVGTGDVASAQKVIYGIQDDQFRRTPTAYGTLSGFVRERDTGLPLRGISVVLQDDKGRYASQAWTQEDGRYIAYLPAGKYKAFAVDRVRAVVESEGFVELANDGTAQIDMKMDSPAMLTVTVRDDRGRALPAKISVEGVYAHFGAEPPRKFLYELPVGDSFRHTDIDFDLENDPNTRRYLERVFYATVGHGGTELRPGKYKVYASHGIEYSLGVKEVELVANGAQTVELTLKHDMPTVGWASGDFHVHSINSVDSDMTLPDRVTSYAVEGVDLVVATDHNYVSDFAPTIDALQLADWVKSSVGLELTTLEMGHFNGFPLKLDPGPVSHGSFAWFRRPPGELFAQLRGLGENPQETLVQVNHPRDTILGYFNEFNMGTYTLEPYKASAFGLNQSPLPDGGVSPYHPSQFSLDFDLLEVFNGKRDMLIFSYRVPTTPLPGPEPTAYPKCTGGQIADCVPAPGEITRVKQTTLDGGTLIQPAFPGAQDDWFSLLSHGHKLTATGTSDSHGPTDEAGVSRTYMKVGPTADGSMRGLSEAACMEALKKGQAIVTNGPFLEVSVNGKDIGDEVVAPTGEITVHVVAKAASWVDLDGVRILRGGRDALTPEVLVDIPAMNTRDTVRLDEVRKFTVPDKSYIVVVAYGNDTMWPVHTPYEIASFQISDAVVAIAGPLANSFGPAKWGKYRPDPVNAVRPYAFTNPVWVSYTSSQALRAPKRVLPVGASQPFQPRGLPDLRKLFGAFHSDPH